MYVFSYYANGREKVKVTPLRRTLAFYPLSFALVAFSKVMQAVKLCSNKVLQFLTEGSG